MTIDPVLQIALRVAPAVLFLAAAAHKRSDLRRFCDTLAAYELLPRAWASRFGLTTGAAAGTRIAALALIALEGAVAFALLASLVSSRPASLGPIAAGAGVALLLAYAAAIGVNLWRGRAIDCGCGGPMLRERLIGADLLVRNLVLALALAAASLPVSGRSMGVLDVAVAGFFALASVLVLSAAETALENAARSLAPRSATGRTA